MTRRGFLRSFPAAALVPHAGEAASPDEIRAVSLHLGFNMWCDWYPEKGVGADDVIGKPVRLCRRDLGGRGLKGFMMAPWAALDTPEHLAFNRRGIDLFADALNVETGCAVGSTNHGI